MDSSKDIPVDEPLDEHLVAAITSSFESAHIENVLWGDFLLTVFGVPSGVDDVSFVVPDDKIASAYSLLEGMGFRNCVVPAECRTAAAQSVTPTPNVHLHIDGTRFVGLYKKSDTLWNLPSLEPIRKDDNTKPDIIRANDSTLPEPRIGRGRGALSKTLHHPVHIPSVHRLTEAYILLTLRHFQQPMEFFWRCMLTYIIEFVWEDGILDTRLLEPHHRKFFHLFAEPGDTPILRIFEDLQNGRSS